MKRAAACCGVLAAALLVGAGPLATFEGDPERPTRRSPIVLAVERVAPATVNITTAQEVYRRANPFFKGDPLFDEFFRRFLDPRPRTRQSLGTGVLIDPRGYVLTNHHVLAGATQIQVTLSDAREFEGELIGADPDTDLAVVRIESDAPLPAAPLGRSHDLLIGETVIAIGNPFGLNHTVTTGVLSAVNRSIRNGGHDYHGFLQTDTSINPGNSGGPLLNIEGQVIGINTAIFREAQGIGFAIPIDKARRIMDDLIHHGELVPVWLGLRLQELDPRIAHGLGVKTGSGALVANVFDDSPADRGDVVPGDVLLELDGTRIQGVRSYFEVLRGLTDGDVAKLVIERGGKRLERSLTTETFPLERAEELGRLLLGIRVGGSQGRPGLEIEDVVAGSPAGRVGILPGDRVLRIEREPVDDPVAFRKSITKLRGRSRALLIVQRGRNAYHVTLPIT